MAKSSTSFVKGNVGNPKGRPGDHETRDIFLAAGPKAAHRIVALIDSDNEDLALRASKIVIDKVVGDLHESSTTITVRASVRELSEERFRRLSEAVFEDTSSAQH